MAAGSSHQRITDGNPALQRGPLVTDVPSRLFVIAFDFVGPQVPELRGSDGCFVPLKFPALNRGEPSKA